MNIVHLQNMTNDELISYLRDNDDPVVQLLVERLMVASCE
jgi:hypothetical protein